MGSDCCCCPQDGQNISVKENDRVFDSLQFSGNKHHLTIPLRLIRHYFIALGLPTGLMIVFYNGGIKQHDNSF